MNNNLPHYQTLSRQVEAAGLDYTPAESHGIACGILCSMAADFPALWQDAMFADTEANDVLVDEAREALDQLVDITRGQLNTGELALSLMIPSDDEPIGLRVAAVRDWSQGFLYGFGLAGKQAESLFSADAGEALRDLVEISRLDTDQLEDVEQDEDALNQLSEYLWVAALLIRQDLQSSKLEPKT
jgi:uncharacterized protein YgfB (UPF0149 family)